MKQQAIKVPESTTDTRSLHEIIVGILQEFGPRKHEALIEALEASKGHFSEVLAGHGKHWPFPWVDYIVDHFDFRDEVASYYARRRGKVVRPPRKPSAAEELRRLKYALAQHNGIGDALRKEAAGLPDDVFADEDLP